MKIGRQERRRYKRRKCYCLIKYRPVHEKTGYKEVLTSLRNIGGGGVLFKSEEHLAVGTQLEMKVNIPPVGNVIDISAAVIWFERRGRSYWVGAMFLDITEEDRKKIIDFAASGKEDR